MGVARMIIMKKIKGQTLLEVVVATGVVGVALVAMTITVISGVKMARVSRERSEALRIAEDKLESIRNERNMDPDDFFGLGSREYTIETSGEAPVYTIEARVDEIIAGEDVDVEVVVSWVDGDNEYSINKNTALSKWE